MPDAPSKFKFDFNQTVRDTITGFTGIVSRKSAWVYGVNTYRVTNRDDPNNPVNQEMDEAQLEAV